MKIMTLTFQVLLLLFLAFIIHYLILLHDDRALVRPVIIENHHHYNKPIDVWGDVFINDKIQEERKN